MFDGVAAYEESLEKDKGHKPESVMEPEKSETETSPTPAHTPARRPSVTGNKEK
jgi:hypothetical protein